MNWLRGMGMAVWLNSGLKDRLAAVLRFDHRKNSLFWVGFLPDLWVSVFFADLPVVPEGAGILEAPESVRYANPSKVD